jgi:hypothetical protein
MFIPYDRFIIEKKYRLRKTRQGIMGIKESELCRADIREEIIWNIGNCLMARK